MVLCLNMVWLFIIPTFTKHLQLNLHNAYIEFEVQKYLYYTAPPQYGGLEREEKLKFVLLEKYVPN